jgi:sigma-B regulation protein RsbU (phosphoserine phosphatase)
MGDNLELVIVDDEPRVTQSLEREIRLEFGIEAFLITSFNNPEEALSYIKTRKDNVFLVISDLRMPQMNGSELLVLIRKDCPDVQTVLLTAFTDIDNIQRAVSASIQGLLFKPWTRESITNEVEKARHLWTLKRENKILQRRVDEMLRDTGDFQKTLFAQSIPSSTTVAFDISFNPHEDFHCGGDFYKILEIESGRYLALLGDVTGHGPKSAMIAGMVLSALKTITDTDPALRKEPDHLMKRLNDQFCALLSNTPETLVGLAAVYVDMPGRVLSLATAGLPPVAHIRNGTPELLGTPNHMLGAFPDTPFYKTERFLLPGDRIIMSTDGLVESVPEFFHLSTELEIGILAQRADYSAESIVEDCRKLLPGATFTDDVTVLSLEILPDRPA